MSTSNLSSRGQRARERAERARELALAFSDDNDEETHDHPGQLDEEEQQEDQQSQAEEEEEDSQGVNQEDGGESQGGNEKEENNLKTERQVNEGEYDFACHETRKVNLASVGNPKTGQLVITAEVLQALLNNRAQFPSPTSRHSSKASRGNDQIPIHSRSNRAVQTQETGEVICRWWFTMPKPRGKNLLKSFVNSGGSSAVQTQEAGKVICRWWFIMPKPRGKNLLKSFVNSLHCRVKKSTWLGKSCVGCICRTSPLRR